MTLNTYFHVTTPGIDPQEIWNLLMSHVETEDTVPDSVHTGPAKYGRDGQTRMGTRPGSGRLALCDMYYTETGEELSRHPSETDDPELVDWDNDLYYVPRSHICMSFDTAYGYRGPNGEGCSDLHQNILRSLASYVTSHGGEFIWKDEYTGEWHTDTESISTLGYY